MTLRRIKWCFQIFSMDFLWKAVVLFWGSQNHFTLIPPLLKYHWTGESYLLAVQIFWLDWTYPWYKKSKQTKSMNKKTQQSKKVDLRRIIWAVKKNWIFFIRKSKNSRRLMKWSWWDCRLFEVKQESSIYKNKFTVLRSILKMRRSL